MHDHPLRLGVLYLPRMGRHLLAAFQAGQVHLRHPQPHGGARHVKGHVAAAQHHHLVAQFGRLAQPHLPQEDGVEQHPLQVRAGDGQSLAHVRSHGDKHGVETLLEQSVQILRAVVQPQLHALVQDILNLSLDDPRRKAVLGHADAQHAASHGQRLEHRHAVASAHQVTGRAESARAGADNGHVLRPRALRSRHQLPRRLVHHVRDKTLKRSDCQRLVHQVAVAGVLAAVVADAPADAGEGIVFLDDPQRVFVAPLADQGDVPLGALADGTGVATGGYA